MRRTPLRLRAAEASLADLLEERGSAIEYLAPQHCALVALVYFAEPPVSGRAMERARRLLAEWRPRLVETAAYEREQMRGAAR
ncbi:MAG: hypothetical protein ACREFQ_22455 [Stellaceae bacterium]